MFSVGAYAKIWEVKAREERYTDFRISTSRKNKETGEYSQDFGGYVRLVGQAHDIASTLEVKDKFKIVRCGVENSYDKEKNTTFTRFLVFEAEKEIDAEGNPFV